MVKQDVATNKKPKIIIYADNVLRLTCSKCGQTFVSRGIRDMALGFTSYGEPTYVPRDDVLCYNCEAEANAKVIGGPVGE